MSNTQKSTLRKSRKRKITDSDEAASQQSTSNENYKTTPKASEKDTASVLTASKKRKRQEDEKPKKQATLTSLFKISTRKQLEKDNDMNDAEQAQKKRRVEDEEAADDGSATEDQMEDIDEESALDVSADTSRRKRKSTSSFSPAKAPGKTAPLYLRIMNMMIQVEKGKKKTVDVSKTIDVHGFPLKIIPQTRQELEKKYTKATYSKISKHWTKLNKLIDQKKGSLVVLEEFTQDILGMDTLPTMRDAKLLHLMRFMSLIAMVPMERAEAFAEDRALPAHNTGGTKEKPTLEGSWKRLFLLMGSEKMRDVANYFHLTLEGDTPAGMAEMLQDFVTSSSTVKTKKQTKKTNTETEKKSTPAKSTKKSKKSAVSLSEDWFGVDHYITRKSSASSEDGVELAQRTKIVVHWGGPQRVESTLQSFTLPEKDVKLHISTGRSTTETPRQAILVQQKLGQQDLPLPVVDPSDDDDSPQHNLRVAFAGGQILSQHWLPVEDAPLSHIAIAAQTSRTRIMSRELLQSRIVEENVSIPIQVWRVDHTNMEMRLRFRIHHGHSIPYCVRWMPLWHCDLEPARTSGATTTAILGVLACSMSDGALCVYAVPDTHHDTPFDLIFRSTGTSVALRQGEDIVMTALEWTRDGRRLIAGDNLGHVHVYTCNFDNDQVRLTRIMQFNSHTDVVRNIACPDSDFHLFATGSIDGTLTVCSMRNPSAELLVRKCQPGWITAIEFPNYSNAFVCVDHDKGLNQFCVSEANSKFRISISSSMANPFWDVSMCASSGCAAVTTASGSVIVVKAVKEGGQITDSKRSDVLKYATVLETHRDDSTGDYTVQLPALDFADSVKDDELQDAPDFTVERTLHIPGDPPKEILLTSIQGQMQHVSFHPSSKEGLREWMLASNHEGLMFLLKLPRVMSNEFSPEEQVRKMPKKKEQNDKGEKKTTAKRKAKK